MNKLRKILAITTFFTVFSTFSGTLNAAGKVDICHIPPGNPSNAHTINVSQSAVPAHLAHGDRMGTCSNASSGQGNVFAVCDDRSGEIGRRVTMNIGGIVHTQRVECD